jgi:Fe-S cluster assembly scaffold protein SufB
MRTVRLSSISGHTLAINADTLVIDDVSGGEFEISVAGRAKLTYAYADTGEGDARRLIRLAGHGAVATVRGVIMADGVRAKRRIETRLEADDTVADIALLSLARDAGEIDLDGVLAIPEGVKRADGSLAEDNIFLGASGKIRGLPTLLVHSDEVRASHAMRVERVSDERMFYLRSRGMGERESLDALVGA